MIKLYFITNINFSNFLIKILSPSFLELLSSLFISLSVIIFGCFFITLIPSDIAYYDIHSSEIAYYDIHFLMFLSSILEHCH